MDQATARERGPAAGEAKARLAPLHPAQRYAVRSATNTRHVVDHPVLAAATIAAARRSVQRVRLFAVASVPIGIAFAIFVAVFLEGETRVVALVLAISLPAVAAMTFGLTRLGAKAAVKRHLEVLDRHDGVVPPPGPVEDPAAHRSATAFRRQRYAGALAICAMLVGAGAWISWSDHQIGQRLRARGVDATAEVTDYDSGTGKSGLFTGNRWTVRFEVDGSPVEARLVTADVEGTEGERVPVVYDPTDPRVARHADEIMGRRMSVVYVGSAIGGVLVVLAAVLLWQRRSYRAASKAASHA